MRYHTRGLFVCEGSLRVSHDCLPQYQVVTAARYNRLKVNRTGEKGLQKQAKQVAKSRLFTVDTPKHNGKPWI